MKIYRKEPDIQYARVNKDGKNWIVPIERMSPKVTFVEKHFPMIAVATFVGLAAMMIVSAMK